MLKRIPFGPYRPDLPPADALDTARNVAARPNGYAPVKGFQPITTAIAGWRGGSAFVGTDGTAALLSGDGVNLYRWTGSGWASVFTGAAASVWRFAQFGNNVLAVNGGAGVTFDLIGGTAALTGGGPPAADLIMVVRDHVVVAGNPSARQTVTWSGFNASNVWTPGGGTQSGSQEMLSGGEVTGLAGGEYGLVFQRGAIKRMDYVGDELVFQFAEISSNIGCMAKGAVAQAGRQVFFLSERGFMLCDGANVVPIGTEAVDRTFFATYSRDDIDRVTAAVNPRTYEVMWAMPGQPGRVWTYHWEQQRWTTVDLPLKGVFTGFTSNVGLEAVDVLYPGGIDSVPVSLDSPEFAGGNPQLYVVDAGGVTGGLSGPNMAATFGLQDMELVPGNRARVRSARLVGDAVAYRVDADARVRAGDSEAVTTGGDVRSNGEVPLRSNGRHHRFTVTVPAGADWTYAKGLDVYCEPAGRR